MVRLQAFTGLNVKDIFRSSLMLENIPPAPLSPEAEKIMRFEEEEPSYDQALTDLGNYHQKISKRFKSLEERIEQLQKWSDEKSQNSAKLIPWKAKEKVKPVSVDAGPNPN